MGLVGRSPALRALLKRVDQAARSEATVLILGERGTGKELVARAVAQTSARRDRPFIPINCAALPVDLLASELFGHERGAFTGAAERRHGLLVSADTGTVFLDEIGDLSLPAQTVFLRFLQEREVRPLGAARPITVDVRVIAATNQDLGSAVRRGRFRADLYDRLSELTIEVPPLRDRRDDIPVLVEHFLELYSARHGLRVGSVSDAAAALLARYPWPGNVRQLEKTVSRAVILAEHGEIDVEHLELPVPDTEAVGPPGAVRATPGPRLATLTRRQQDVLAIAMRDGIVRRGDLIRRFGISRASARRELAALVQRGLLARLGNNRGAEYAPTSTARTVEARR